MTQSEKAKEFLEEIAAVCRRRGLSLSHEDSQGSFKVVPYDLGCEEWLLAADEDNGNRNP